MKGFRSTFLRKVKVKSSTSGMTLGTKWVRVKTTQLKAPPKPRRPK